LKTVLQQLALKSERFRLEWVSVSEEARFATIIKDMTKEIKKLGPNPLKVGGISNG
jgi:coenzyme F420-reducing hydrogenase delta subunit